MLNTNDFEYLKLADLIQEDINNGIYSEGSKLPSVRKLRVNHNLSISTVLRAFYELEKRGFVTAKEKSGYFVNERIDKKFFLNHSKKCNSKPESINKTNLINSVIRTLSNREMFKLSSSLLPSALAPVKRIESSLKEAINQNDYDINSYCIEICRINKTDKNKINR